MSVILEHLYIGTPVLHAGLARGRPAPPDPERSAAPQSDACQALWDREWEAAISYLEARRDQHPRDTARPLARVDAGLRRAVRRRARAPQSLNPTQGGTRT